VRVVNSENGSNSSLHLGSQYPEPADTNMGITFTKWEFAKQSHYTFV
jgi:hypothetical protein